MGERFAIGSVLGYLVIVSWVCSVIVLGAFQKDGPMYRSPYTQECISETLFPIPKLTSVQYFVKTELQCAMSAHKKKAFSYTYKDAECWLNGKGLGEPSKFSAFHYGIDFETSLKELAIGSPVYGSPSHSPGNSIIKSVNGNPNDLYESAHGIPRPWWMVDLGANYAIYNITIRTRTENCCAGRFHDIEIRVGKKLSDASSFKLLFSYPGPYNGTYGMLVCWKPDGILGRYVSIQRTQGNDGGLQLSDVRVYGFRMT